MTERDPETENEVVEGVTEAIKKKVEEVTVSMRRPPKKQTMILGKTWGEFLMLRAHFGIKEKKKLIRIRDEFLRDM